MLFSWLPRVSQPRRRPSPQRRRPRLEALEDRLVPSTDIWTGAALIDPSWRNPLNWSANAIPAANDSLIFPALAFSHSAVNNFTAGTRFAAITFEGSGYSLSGNTVPRRSPSATRPP
jgi:hypothetical protein